MFRSLLHPIALSIALAGVPVSLKGQNPGCPRTSSYPCGALARPSDETAQSILDALQRQPVSTWADAVLRPFFGELYDDHYVDWVVFLDTRSGRVFQGLYRGGKLIKDDRLRGEENVWVVVFSTSRLGLPAAETSHREAVARAALDSATASCLMHGLDCRMDITLTGANPVYVKPDDEPAPLILRREVIKQAPSPVLAAAFRALAGGLLGDAVKEESIGDTTFAITFDSLFSRPVASMSDRVNVYVGLTRVRMPGNALVRLALRPGGGTAIPGHLGVFRNIANGRRSPWSAGLALSGTLNAQEPKFTDGVHKGHTEPFRTSLLLYLGRSIHADRAPQGRGSFSLVGGTNVVTGDLFRDLFFGISGSTSSNLSLLTGINYARLLERHRGGDKQVSRRDLRLMVGLGLSIQ